MSNKFETADRIFHCELRAEQDEEHGKMITGRPIVYNQETDIGPFTEIIDRGALDKADLTDVPFLVNHDISRVPLARSRNNNANSTMQMSIDENGMSIRVNLDTERNAAAAELYSAVERGDIDGMSFRFSVDDERWEALDSDHPIRHILSISKVRDVSAVTFPAYEGTSISARSASEALDSAKAALDSARAKAKEARIPYEKLQLKLKLMNF